MRIPATSSFPCITYLTYTYPVCCVNVYISVTHKAYT
uniref:Uncharacterized protein n=1 Tax=Anguilla anguilla TaxID=7936 RepID=A0A0E9UJA3_ANGAN